MTISFSLDYGPAGLVFSAPAIADMAEELGVSIEKIASLAWWKGAGSPSDVVHPRTLSRLGEKAIEAHGNLVAINVR